MNVVNRSLPTGVETSDGLTEAQHRLLNSDVLVLLARLHREFEPRRQELLRRRRVRNREISTGLLPDFLSETRAIRAATWHVAPPAPGLHDRRVGIIGPPELPAMHQAVASNANVYLADFEDTLSPTLRNVLQGHMSVRDAYLERMSFRANPSGVGEPGTPTIMIRPRGWHLVERGIRIDGMPVSAGLFDFCLYMMTSAQLAIESGQGPYLVLPKIEGHFEARVWNDIFIGTQADLGIPFGTIRATALIETITAAFEMDEILYELRDHSAGLRAGRCDYIFSAIKRFRLLGEQYLLPDRAQVTATVPFMRTYSQLLVQTCHLRGAHAIGGMSASLPCGIDSIASMGVLQSVQQDALREAYDGFDGSWVTHMDIVPTVREAFDTRLGSSPHQLEAPLPGIQPQAADLLDLTSATGAVTLDGLRSNVRLTIHYLEAWLRGSGAVVMDNHAQDTATAEISRTQLWQWIGTSARCAEGPVVTRDLVLEVLNSELQEIRTQEGEVSYSQGRYAEATDIFGEIVLRPEFVEFLTIPAYARLSE